LRPIRPPEKSKEDILLFFKLYNPEKEELRYISSICSQALSSFLDTVDSDTDIIFVV
jgi:ubiquitin carboxyl-terminal hydrolase 7